MLPRPWTGNCQDRNFALVSKVYRMTQKYDPKYSQCPICQSSAVSLFHHDFRDNDIYKCGNCTAQFMNPVYSDDYLDEFYSTYIMPEYTPKYLAEQQETCRDNFSAIGKFKSGVGTMLDFGLGNGGHSAYAKNAGWQVTGYDVDCGTTERIAKELSIDVHCGDFEKIDWQGQQFDLLYAHHVVEHLKDPVRRLKGLRELLKDDGYFYIGVPNIASLASRLKFGLEKLGIRRKNIGKYYDSDHHVFYYTPRSLTKMLALAGFTVVHQSNATKPRPYQGKLRKAFRQNITEKLYANTAFFVIAKKD